MAVLFEYPSFTVGPYLLPVISSIVYPAACQSFFIFCRFTVYQIHSTHDMHTSLQNFKVKCIIVLMCSSRCMKRSPYWHGLLRKYIAFSCSYLVNCWGKFHFRPTIIDCLFPVTRPHGKFRAACSFIIIKSASRDCMEFCCHMSSHMSLSSSWVRLLYCLRCCWVFV